MKKKVRTSIIVFLSALLVVCICYFTIPSDKVILLNSEDAFDLRDTEMLVGWADNVFIVEIVRIIDTKSDDVSPVTTYEAKVVENIKGNLSDTVTISHRIGYSKTARATIKFPDDNVLVEGDSYLIISRYNDETNSHWLVPVHGNRKVTDDTMEEILDMYEENVRNQKEVDY